MIASNFYDPRIQQGTTQTIQYPAERAYYFLDMLRRQRYSIAILQELGLFSQAEAGTDSKVRWHSLSGEVFPVRSYESSCDWNPTKANYIHSLEETRLCDLEVALEYCESYMDACFRALFQMDGMELRDFAWTVSEGGPGLQKWIATRDRIMEDIHNNLMYIAFFGQHPHLDAAKDELTYKITAQQFDGLYESLQSCKGLITEADEIWNDPREYSEFKLELSVDGKGKYIGMPSEDFENVVAANETLTDVKYGENEMRPSLFLLVTDDVFQAYRKELKTQGSECCGDNGSVAQMILGIENLPIVERAAQLNGRPFSNSILEWEGIPVVNMSGFSKFDKKIGLKTSRIIGVRAGNLGWFTRGGTINGEDMGLIIQRDTRIEEKGKVKMYSAYQMATKILFPEMMTMARPANPVQI